MRTRGMDQNAIRIRMQDAQKFLEIAELYISESDHASWKVAASNAIHSGIAASDAICGHALGYCSGASDHREAVRLLKKVLGGGGGAITQSLGRLITEKSLFQYGSDRISQAKAIDMVKYAKRLIAEMNERIPY